MPSAKAGLPFSKLEALGNDFMLIDARRRAFEADEQLVQRWGDRRLGVGFDQMLILRKPTDPAHACRVDIRNCDGSRAEQCGNGMRAVALWLRMNAGANGPVLLETPAGTVEAAPEADDLFRASLTVPRFEPAALGLSGVDAFPWSLRAGSEALTVHGASLGNPHLLVISHDPPDRDRLERVAGIVGGRPELTRGANIGLARIVDRQHVTLRVFERGAGPTRACGSGASAAAAMLIRLGHVDSPVNIDQPGGRLVVDWAGDGSPVVTSGPARHVFEGVIAWPTANP
ncbi:MAG: diaminopimelate epimerase [Gammaproteobacteria bacterium]|jgi:diaminopimelate epimerase|nr:diaminopimelate epimerase [Gammaproteobacteria bacterium]